MKSNQHVIVLTGAAGTGKTTIQNYLKQKHQINPVITHTTRKERPGEKNGINYYFENKESFARLHLLEAVNYAGNQYGSSIEGIERALANQNLATIVLDTAGAITYQKKLKEQAKIIFLSVCQADELRDRMISRGDSLAEVEKRINSKEDNRDLSLPDELLDHATVIYNENLDQTLHEVDQIIEKLNKH
ncbi:guanylate kinase [Fructilactobacillus vespulae]|uniref:guanylate kinase n=1 Tax=Fructilactobacillus vespulae TaxID=1249630 RepID=UPI0039B6E3A3